MKILLLKNNIIDNDTLQKGIVLVKEYASKIGLDLDFTQVETVKEFTSVPFTNGMDTGSGYQINPQEVFDEAKRLGYVFSPDNIAVVVFDSTKIIPNPTNPIDNGVMIQIPMNWYGAYPDVFAQYFLHELCHYSSALNNTPDLTHKKYDLMWNGQWNQLSNNAYYLHLLKALVKTPSAITSKYKYFNLTEKTGSSGTIADLSPKLVEMLDKAREIAGIPFSITSGYRTKDKNESVGGVEGSSHTERLAVDIRARNSNEHYLITKGLIGAGFTRISRKYPSHIHCDISTDKPQNVLF